LVGQLRDQGVDPIICTSEVKEPASIWAIRLWKTAAETLLQGNDIAIFLNDDVTVSPDLICAVDVLRSWGSMVSLHTQLPTAPSLAEYGQRFLTSYWLSGPGYMLNLNDIEGLLEFVEDAPKKLLTVWNEDGWANLFAWRLRTPILHTIPALVKHDVAVPSTLGYDTHPLRNASITWEHPMFYGHDLASPYFWHRDKMGIAPTFIPCPWMDERRLRALSSLYELGDYEDALCLFCGKNPGAVGIERGGPTACAQCLQACVTTYNNTRNNI
jgi:hypothetical protein